MKWLSPMNKRIPIPGLYCPLCAQEGTKSGLFKHDMPFWEYMPENYRMALYILSEGVPLNEIPLNDEALLRNMYDRAMLSRREHMATSPEANRFRNVIEPAFTKLMPRKPQCFSVWDELASSKNYFKFCRSFHP